MSQTELLEQPGERLAAASANPDGDFDVSSLLSCARKANQQSLGELLEHYRNYLFVLASAQIQRRLQPRVSPSDVVQETMLRAHRRFGQFRGQTERELLGWLRRILLTSLARFVEQHVLAAKRDIRREVSIESFAASFERSTAHFASVLRAEVPTPSAAALQREDAVALADLLAQLAPRYREVLILRNIQGQSFDEIAARLDRSAGATRMLWLRAIEKLRVIYRKETQHDS